MLMLRLRFFPTVRACLALAALFALTASAQTSRETTLAAAQKAVSDRFKELEKTSTVKLVGVSTPNRPNLGPVLEVTLRPPTAEKFEFHAETGFVDCPAMSADAAFAEK